MRKLFLFIPIVLILTALSGSVNGDNMTHITDVTELQNMNLDVTEDYILDNDIDASATSGWNGGAGFEPVGTLGSPFIGSFDGQNYEISNLYINRPAGFRIGLFGRVASSKDIKNVYLKNCNVTGNRATAGLIGNHAGSGLVSNCLISGTVIAGGNETYRWDIALLIGENSPGAVIRNCFSEGNVTGLSDVGGLIGDSGPNGVIEKSYSLANVGGGPHNTGGLIGGSRSTVSNCYAHGSVSGADDVGGLIGEMQFGATVDKCYSKGSVNGLTDVGGLIGKKTAGTVTNSFWDTETSGQAASAGGTGKTTVEMNTESTFTDAGWDFNTIWNICDPPTPAYPWLRWQGIVCSGGVVISLIA